MPVAHEVLGGCNGPATAHFVNQQLPNFLLLVVHQRGVRKHGVPTTAGLTIVVQREGEAVRRRDRSSLHFQSRDPLPRRPGDVERVIGAGDNIEVEARKLRVDANGAIRRREVVPRTLLEIRAQLRTTDANRAQRIVVRIERLHACCGDCPRVDRGVERERGRRRELGARRLPLHLEDEVDEWRIHNPRGIRAPGHDGPPERLGDPFQRRRVRCRRGGDHGGVLRTSRGLNHERLFRSNAPAVRGALEAQVRDRNARGPVLRLHEEHTVDHGVADLLVRVPIDDEVDARHLAGNTRRHVLARDARGDRVVARGSVEPRVHGDEDNLRSCTPNFLHRLPHRGHDIADDQPALQVVAIPHHGTRGRGADDADLHPAARDDGPSAESALAVWPIRVCGQERKRRLRNRTLEKWHAVVELMIAHGRRVVMHRVHRGHDRMRRAARGDARCHVRERVALEKVARVEQDHASRCGCPDRVDYGCRARKAPGEVLAIRLVVPAADAAVHVGRGGDDEVVRPRLCGELERDDTTSRNEGRCGSPGKSVTHGKKLACGFILGEDAFS